MADIAGTVDLIKEFVELAIARQKQTPSADVRARTEAIDQALRDMIDGARPRPRRIEGAPAAAAAATRTPLPAKGPVAKPSTLDAFAKKIDVNIKDKKKLREISVDQLPKSRYTVSHSPAFLAAYYAEDIVPLDDTSARNLVPKRIVDTTGEPFELSAEARTLLGLPAPAGRAVVKQDNTDVLSAGTPAGVRQAAGGPPSPAVGRAEAQAPAAGRPVIVHLLQGGVRRGHVEDFDPATGAVQFSSEAQGPPIPVNDVLAIFFGLIKGEEPEPPAGQRVVVKLVNDRQVAGVTDDYQEGGDALTVIPDQRRGQVDRIWIPAWAVKEIQLG